MVIVRTPFAWTWRCGIRRFAFKGFSVACPIERTSRASCAAPCDHPAQEADAQSIQVRDAHGARPATEDILACVGRFCRAAILESDIP
jgi:hypothetical protein